MPPPLPDSPTRNPSDDEYEYDSQRNSLDDDEEEEEVSQETEDNGEEGVWLLLCIMD